jgi:hypothetical protein
MAALTLAFLAAVAPPTLDDVRFGGSSGHAAKAAPAAERLPSHQHPAWLRDPLASPLRDPLASPLRDLQGR